MLRALVNDEQLTPCGIGKVELCEELHKTIVDRIVNLFTDREASKNKGFNRCIQRWWGCEFGFKHPRATRELSYALKRTRN